MRDDLRFARHLTLRERLLLRHSLRRADCLLHPSETVQFSARGWWRGDHCLVLVTASRVLLIRCSTKYPHRDHMAFDFDGLTHLSAHEAPPAGARLRIAAGSSWEEFSVLRHGCQMRQFLMTAQP
ncbi:hypothetical protein AVL61_15160 [Kocuria rosea subsp. polaris]|uniref:YokE-like PH domain-containing protein n=1 Tax=Kocuria rosea subsp. polaris TaxID=136273 RepID=A0A0W8I6K0_KOCRO|nr:hypothetical protein [Kocuria polaris]KUG53867.1 hypothetical protein AVL61_15160 [Kocuria polaris]